MLLRYDVASSGAFLALLDVEGHFLTFGQRLEAAALNGAVVDEDVLGAIVRSDEAKTFLVTEPLNCTCSHFGYLLIRLNVLYMQTIVERLRKGRSATHCG